MRLSRRDQYSHGFTRRSSEAKDRIDSLPPDKRGVPPLVQRVLVSSLIGGWYASGGIESRPRRVATKVGVLGFAFAVIWMTTESSEDSADADNNSPKAAENELSNLGRVALPEATVSKAAKVETAPSESASSQAMAPKLDNNGVPSPWGWARLGLAISAVVAYFVGSFYFSRFIRRKAVGFIRAHITESRPWTVYGVLVGVVCFALSFSEDKRTAKLDTTLRARA